METTRHRRKRHGGTLLFITSCWLTVASVATGQEQPEPSPPRPTTTTPAARSSVDHLQVMLRPLTKGELEVELGGWLDQLQAKIREVGDTELKLKSLAEGDSQWDSLTQQLLTLRTEESELVFHFRSAMCTCTHHRLRQNLLLPETGACCARPNHGNRYRQPREM